MFLIGIFWKNCEPPYTPGVYGAKAVMMKDKKFLITGSGGQLARAFISSLEAQGLAYLAPRKDKLDITNPGQVLAVAGVTGRMSSSIAPPITRLISRKNTRDAFSVNSDAVREFSRGLQTSEYFPGAF